MIDGKKYPLEGRLKMKDPEDIEAHIKGQIKKGKGRIERGKATIMKSYGNKKPTLDDFEYIGPKEPALPGAFKDYAKTGLAIVVASVIAAGGIAYSFSLYNPESKIAKKIESVQEQVNTFGRKMVEYSQNNTKEYLERK